MDTKEFSSTDNLLHQGIIVLRHGGNLQVDAQAFDLPLLYMRFNPCRC